MVVFTLKNMDCNFEVEIDRESGMFEMRWGGGGGR